MHAYVHITNTVTQLKHTSKHFQLTCDKLQHALSYQLFFIYMTSIRMIIYHRPCRCNCHKCESPLNLAFLKSITAHVIMLSDSLGTKI